MKDSDQSHIVYQNYIVKSRQKIMENCLLQLTIEQKESTNMHTHTHTHTQICFRICIYSSRTANNQQQPVPLGKGTEVAETGLERDFSIFSFLCLKRSIFKCPTHYSVVNNLQVSKLSFCLKVKDLSACKVDCCTSFSAAIILDYCGHGERIIATYVWFCFPGRCWLQDVMWVYQMNTLKKR